MTQKYIFFSTLFYCVFLSIVSGILYFLYDTEFLKYIDSAFFASGISSLFLLARKYMTDSYGNEKYHDFFLLDSVLLCSGMVLFSLYFIVSL